MQKPNLFTKSMLALAVVSVGITSCKDDDESSANTASFVNSSLSVDEGDGTLAVEVKLDKPASKDVTIEYEISGTASDRETAGATNYDFEIDSDYGTLTIPEGESSATIDISIKQDALYEGDETIEIAMTDVDDSNVILSSSKNEIKITLRDDESEADRPKVSFASTTLSANEADGTEGYLEVVVTLDKPAPVDLTLEYTLAGTADDSIAAFNNERLKADYYINGEVGILEIPKGATEAIIEIQIYSDFYLEDDETIEIAMTGISNEAQIGTNEEIEITVAQQDGKIVALFWDPEYTTVDMDMFLWIGANEESLGLGGLSTDASFESPEILIIPDIIANAYIGMSYTYYEGTESPMNFEVQLIDFADGVVEDEDGWEGYLGEYTLSNINAWDTEAGIEPVIVQTLQKIDGEFTNISTIATPSTGSRVKAMKIPAGTPRAKVPGLKSLSLRH